MSRRRSRSGWPRWRSCLCAGPVTLAECEWWCADACDAVAAEVSAAQNISHARAVGQVQFACALRHRLPAVAKVFAPGRSIFGWSRPSSAAPRTLMTTVMPQLDDAIARHAEKWMRLSGPEAARSGGSVGGQVRSGRGAGAAEGQGQPLCRHRAGQPGHGRDLGPAARHRRGGAGCSVWMRWRPRCATTIRAPKSSAAPMRAGRWARGEATLACQCGSGDCPAAAERNNAPRPRW